MPDETDYLGIEINNNMENRVVNLGAPFFCYDSPSFSPSPRGPCAVQPRGCQRLNIGECHSFTDNKNSVYMNTPSKPMIVQPGAGQDLHAFGHVLSVMLGGEHTNSNLTVMFDVAPPGGGPPLHVHSREDELFLVVEGRISFFVEGHWTEVAPGGAVFLPRGSAHHYRNVGTTPSRQWILTTPSGFETFFARCADECAKPDGPDMDRNVEIQRDHGIELLADAH